MTMAIFGPSKAKQIRDAIADMEIAVEGKRVESTAAEDRLRKTLTDAVKEMTRSPVAGSLIWRGRRDA